MQGQQNIKKKGNWFLWTPRVKLVKLMEESQSSKQ